MSHSSSSANAETKEKNSTRLHLLPVYDIEAELCRLLGLAYSFAGEDDDY